MSRLIDADALIAEIKKNRCADCDRRKGIKKGKITFVYDFGEAPCRACDVGDTIDILDEAPTVGGWISVKDRLPSEHDSLFANHPHLSKHMWTKESDDVIVYVVFPDGTGRATEGRLRDGKWHTKISPTLESVVTHWMPLPSTEGLNET